LAVAATQRLRGRMSASLQALLHEQGGDKEEMLESLGLSGWCPPPPAAPFGPDPVPTELQQLEIQKLATRLKGVSSGKSSAKGKAAEDEDEDDEAAAAPSSFDLLAKPRVLLFEGKVLKRSSSAFKKTSKRHLVLLNDALLVTTAKSSLLSKTEKLTVNAVIPLDELAIRPYWSSEPSSSQISSSDSSNKGAHNPLNIGDDIAYAFEILSADRSFQFMAENESDKRVWMETLISATLAFAQGARQQPPAPGWQHMRNRGTLVSAVMRGEMKEISF